MRIVKTIALALLALAVPAAAQDKGFYFSEHDLQSTSFICAAFTGKDGNPYGQIRQGQTFITTSGSSTTTTALAAGTQPFVGISVGSLIAVQTGPALADVLYRYVTAKASNDSITVNSAWDLGAAGRAFYYYGYSQGTTVNDGWINIGALNLATIHFRIDTFNATSDDVKIECRHSTFNSQPNIVFPPPAGAGASCLTGNFTAVGGCIVTVEDAVDACRVCFKANTPGGAQSVSADVIRIPRNAK